MAVWLAGEGESQRPGERAGIAGGTHHQAEIVCGTQACMDFSSWYGDARPGATPTVEQTGWGK